MHIDVFHLRESLIQAADMREYQLRLLLPAREYREQTLAPPSLSLLPIDADPWPFAQHTSSTARTALHLEARSLRCTDRQCTINAQVK
eukprot:970566-Amphidinium_carterae.1